MAAPRAISSSTRRRRAGSWSSASRSARPTRARPRAGWMLALVPQDPSHLSDASGWARPDDWYAGRHAAAGVRRAWAAPNRRAGVALASEVCAASAGAPRKRGEELSEVGDRAAVRGAGRRSTSRCWQRPTGCGPQVVGDTVTYVINRNINYTNICLYHCGFCAFSKGRRRAACAVRPTTSISAEIARRTSRGALRQVRPKSACRAASIRATPARPTSTS